MQNFPSAIEATNTAMESTGSATKENERYMESLTAKVTQVKATFQDLANNVIQSEVVKAILDLANAFLQLLNTPIGSFVTQIVLLTGALSGFIGVMKAMNIVTIVTQQFSALIPIIKNLIFTISGAAGPMVATAGVMSSFIPIALGVSVALAAIAAIAPKVSDWYKTITNDVEYASEKLQENQTQLNENNEKLKNLLAVPPSNRTDEINNEIEALRNENAELQNNIDNWQKRKDQGTLEDLRQETHELTSGQYILTDSMVVLVDNAEDALEKLKEMGLVAKDFKGTLEEAGYTLSNLDASGVTIELSGDDYYEEIINQQEEFVEKVKNNIEVTAEEIELYDERTSEIKKWVEALESVPYDSLTDAEKNQIKVGKDLVSNYEDIINTVYNTNDSLNILTKGGNLNEVQFKQLTNVYPNLIDVLEQADGTYRLNEQSLYDLAAAGDSMARSIINNQIAATEATIQSVRDRINAYQQEVTALATLYNAMNIGGNKISNNQILAGGQGPLNQNRKPNIYDFVVPIGSSMNYQQYQKDVSQLKDLESKLQELKNQASSWSASASSVSIGGGGGSSSRGGSSGSSGGSSSSETDPLEEQNKLFQEQNDIIEHNIYLREKQGATNDELIKLNRQYQEVIHQEAEWYRKQGLSDDSEYIREAQKKWLELQDTITELQRDSFDDRLADSERYIEDRNKLNDWGADSEIDAWKRVLDWMAEWYAQGLIDYEYYIEKRRDALYNLIDAEEAAWEAAEEARKEAQQEVIDSLEEQINAYEAAFDYVAKKAQEEIDALEEQKQAIQDKYDAQIEALQETNDELEDQIAMEKALDALAKARQTKVMVYKDGRFQYVNDIEKVSEAQADLESLKREQQLQEEIENLEDLRDAEIDSIEEQIKYWEKYEKEYSEATQHYTDEQNKLLAEQVLGIDLEGENWEKRLGNLEDYISEYEDLLGRLEEAQEDLNKPLEPGSGGSNGTNEDGEELYDGMTYREVLEEMVANARRWTEATSQSEKDYWHRQNDYLGKLIGAHYDDKTGKWDVLDYSNGFPQVPKYKNGTLSAKGGISLVGEKGPELRVLGTNDGVIPSEITKNLWSWGMFTPAQLMNTLGEIGNKLGQITNITIDTFSPNLPNVNNGQDFAEYLSRNFVGQVIQFQGT